MTILPLYTTKFPLYHCSSIFFFQILHLPKYFIKIARFENVLKKYDNFAFFLRHFTTMLSESNRSVEPVQPGIGPQTDLVLLFYQKCM